MLCHVRPTVFKVQVQNQSSVSNLSEYTHLIYDTMIPRCVFEISPQHLQEAQTLSSGVPQPPRSSPSLNADQSCARLRYTAPTHTPVLFTTLHPVISCVFSTGLNNNSNSSIRELMVIIFFLFLLLCVLTGISQERIQ